MRAKGEKTQLFQEGSEEESTHVESACICLHVYTHTHTQSPCQLRVDIKINQT